MLYCIYADAQGVDSILSCISCDTLYSQSGGNFAGMYVLDLIVTFHMFIISHFFNVF